MTHCACFIISWDSIAYHIFKCNDTNRPSTAVRRLITVDFYRTLFYADVRGVNTVWTSTAVQYTRTVTWLSYCSKYFQNQIYKQDSVVSSLILWECLLRHNHAMTWARWYHTELKTNYVTFYFMRRSPPSVLPGQRNWPRRLRYGRRSVLVAGPPRCKTERKECCHFATS